MDKQELLKDLTDEQREAAMHTEGPLLIVAGAGSGKTRVITRRVAYLLAQGVLPSSILAITFTNKAAGEMKTRIAAQVDRPLRDWGRLDQPSSIICTFHSLGLRILKHYAAQIGLAPNFTVYDSSDQERLLKEAIKTVDLSTTNFPASMVHGKISDAKNALQTADAYKLAAGDYLSKSIAKIYGRYQKLLEQNNALDFDDLLMKVPLSFRDHPSILTELQERFQYILIDEYQDTNHAQYMIAHLLAMKHKNICVVGDPDQSIYAWRGADIRNILDFEKDYPDAKVVRLEQNYRSTKTILQIASKLIANNRQRKDKQLWTENEAGQPATLFLCGDEHEEARQVALHFKKLHKEGYAWSQMAVFYRMNSLMRVIEDALRKAAIPYRIARGVDFYHRKEIKDVLAYLRVIANPADELSLTRIVNTPARGISDTTVRQLQLLGLSRGQSLWQVMTMVQHTDLPARAQMAVKQFVQLVERWRGMLKSPGTVEVATEAQTIGDDGQFHLDLPEGTVQQPAEKIVVIDVPASDVEGVEIVGSPGVRALMEDVVKTGGIDAYLHKIGGAEQDESSIVYELISSAAEYDTENPQGSLEDYLARISLLSDVDALKDTGGAVTLMTLHAAKGLEFPVVSMIGMEEGCLPHGRVREHPEQLEEERRLCFVGITRAQKLLVLSRAANRTVRGLRERTAASRFLAEMPVDALRVIKLSDEGGDGAGNLDSPLGSAFRRGQTVRHPQFGLGTIADISEMGQHTRAIVEFRQAGRKTLILQYARLEAV